MRNTGVAKCLYYPRTNFSRLYQILESFAPPQPLPAKLSYIDRLISNISFPLVHHFDFPHKKIKKIKKIKKNLMYP